MLPGNPVLQTRYHVLLPRCPIQTSCHPSRGVLFSLNIKVLLLACPTTQQCKIVINASNRPRSSRSHRGASQHHLCLIWKHKHPGNKKQATESHVACLCEYQLQLKISWFMDIYVIHWLLPNMWRREEYGWIERNVNLKINNKWYDKCFNWVK